MKLNILERIIILGILPKQADFISIKIITDLQKEVGFSQNELDKSNIKVLENGSISWDNDFEKEIKVTKRAAEIIIKGLKELSEKNSVTAQHISIFEKFKVDIEIPKDEEEFIGGEDHSL